MRTRFLSVVIFVVIPAAATVLHFSLPRRTGQDQNQTKNLSLNQSKPMKITSPAFEEKTDIPTQYTCDGENVNPPLAISDVPAEAKSLALVLDDPDAPVPGGFVHWVLFNFDPRTTAVGENSVPVNGIQGQNGTGQPRYTGPCPPSGIHHYHFKLYALDSTLNLDSSAKREDVEQAMAGHILTQTELLGFYKRP
jgi:hypothetical protein